jgi:hypothetical protein
MISFNIFIPTIPIFNFYKSTYTKNLHLKWVKFIIKIFYQNGVFFDSSNSCLKTGYVDRSKEFWDYKLLKKNNFLIKINNVDIIFKLEDYLYIGDINIDKIKNRVLFKLNLLFFSILIFCPIIKTYASPGTNIEKLLKPISQIKISLPFCIKKFDQSLNTQNLNKKWYGNSANKMSSRITKTRKMVEIGKGSLNLTPSNKMSFTKSNDENVLNRALIRVRRIGGG